MSIGEFTTSIVKLPAVQAKIPDDKVRTAAQTKNILLNIFSPFILIFSPQKKSREC
jgi:hypothetical protein